MLAWLCRALRRRCNSSPRQLTPSLLLPASQSPVCTPYHTFVVHAICWVHVGVELVNQRQGLFRSGRKIMAFVKHVLYNSVALSIDFSCAVFLWRFFFTHWLGSFCVFWTSSPAKVSLQLLASLHCVGDESGPGPKDFAVSTNHRSKTSAKALEENRRLILCREPVGSSEFSILPIWLHFPTGPSSFPPRVFF